MYRYEDETKKRVMDTLTGERNIHPGLGRWRDYEEWVENGGITEEFHVDTEGDLASIRNDVFSLSQDDIDVHGIVYRATIMDRCRMSSMLVLASGNALPYSELMLADGSLRIVGKIDLEAILGAILARDQELIRSAVNSIASIKGKYLSGQDEKEAQ